jgi:excisionase family DNA binding protein
MVSPVKAESATTPTNKLLSVEDVAALLQVPVSWVYERTRRRGRDRLPGFHLGKYWRFDEGEVRAWLEQQRGGDRGHI